MTEKDKAIEQARTRLRESVEKYKKERNEKDYRESYINIEEKRAAGEYDYDDYAESRHAKNNEKAKKWNDFVDTLVKLDIDYEPCNLSHVYIKNFKGQTLMVYPKTKKISVKGQKPRKFYRYKNTEEMLLKYGVLQEVVS